MSNIESVPESISDLVKDYSWNTVLIGQSSTGTYCLKKPQCPTYFLKVSKRLPRRDLLDEYNVLKWLSHRLPVPEVICFEEDDTFDFLLLSEIPGIDAASVNDRVNKTDLVKLLAQGLRMVHSLSIENCPFDKSLNVMIEIADYNVKNGLVDESDFDEIRHGITADVLYKELVSKKPDSESVA